MAMKSVRQIEEICRQAGLDPRVTSIMCEMAERLKVQHQQDASMAEVIGKLIDQLGELSKKLNALGTNIDKSGVLAHLKQQHADLSKVDENDDDTQSTHEFTRKTSH